MINISLLYHRPNRRERNYHTQSFVLCNVEQGASKEVGTDQAILCTNRGAFTHWIGSLKPGYYVLIPFSASFWNEDNGLTKDYTLVIHSKVQLNLQVTYEPPTLLADCLIATVLRNHNHPKKVCTIKFILFISFCFYLSRQKIIIIMLQLMNIILQYLLLKIYL